MTLENGQVFVWKGFHLIQNAPNSSSEPNNVQTLAERPGKTGWSTFLIVVSHSSSRLQHKQTKEALSPRCWMSCVGQWKLHFNGYLCTLQMFGNDNIFWFRQDSTSSCTTSSGRMSAPYPPGWNNHFRWVNYLDYVDEDNQMFLICYQINPEKIHWQRLSKVTVSQVINFKILVCVCVQMFPS